jgi:hypothetical protein
MTKMRPPTNEEQQAAAEFLYRCLSHVGWDPECIGAILKGPTHFYAWLRTRVVQPPAEFQNGIRAYFERNNYAPCQRGERAGYGPTNHHIEVGHWARHEQGEPMIHPAFQKKGY